MGVLNLSVAQSAYAQQGTTSGILVREEEDVAGERKIRLVWSTEWGTPRQDRWVITMEASGYPVGDTYSVPIGSATETFPSSECHETKPDGDSGRVWWSHDLDVGGLLSKILGPTKKWMYSTRQYDTVDFVVSVHSIFNEPLASGQAESDTAWLDFSIGYCPTYVITGAHYEAGDVLVIDYETSWLRKDDRFSLEEEASRPGGACTVDGVPLLYAGVHGTISSIGRIEVPASKLTQHVAGKSVYLNIWFNASYRPISLEFAHAVGTVTVVDNRTCSTPFLTLLEVGETIRIATSDTHDQQLSSEYVTIKMVGSKYSVDQVTVPMGGVAEFRFAPFSSTVEFEAVGYTSGGATSRVSTRRRTTTPASTGAIVIDPVTQGRRVRLDTFETGSDIGPTVSTSPQVETVKLAGRKRPSAYYGEGATSTVSVSAALLGDASDVEALAEVGDVMLRFPDGRRYCIAPNVKVSRVSEALVKVTISGSEVGG